MQYKYSLWVCVQRAIHTARESAHMLTVLPRATRARQTLSPLPENQTERAWVSVAVLLP